MAPPLCNTRSQIVRACLRRAPLAPL